MNRDSTTNHADYWGPLEEISDASVVVTRSMQVLYLNATAKSLVPEDWRGLRCWELFPVGDTSCASRCPAIKAVQSASGISYCEEEIYPDGAPVRLGVAVIPLPDESLRAARAVLVLRPKNSELPEETFREALLRDALALRVRCESII
jgi:hypothetical protein